jgi:hypothetical protein
MGLLFDVGFNRRRSKTTTRNPSHLRHGNRYPVITRPNEIFQVQNRNAI